MKWIASALLFASSLLAAPKAVVFDFGGVMASPDAEHIIRYLCATFQIDNAEFKKANAEKKASLKQGGREEDFWIAFGKGKGIALSPSWADEYQAEMRKALGVDEEMYRMVGELKARVQVGMLSNIWESLAEKIRVHGLYEPFEPCLLSCEMGIEKPDARAYELLLQTLSLPAAEVVFIDDRIENIDAAKAMGLDAILFESADQIRRELSQRELLDK